MSFAAGVANSLRRGAIGPRELTIGEARVVVPSPAHVVGHRAAAEQPERASETGGGRPGRPPRGRGARPQPRR
jgi:hypothetical protein